MKTISVLILIKGALIALIGGFVATLIGAFLAEESFRLLSSPSLQAGVLLSLVPFLGAGILVALSGLRKIRSEVTPSEMLSEVRNAEDRLDELERLKRRDMVTPEEYAAKRQEILKEL